MLVTIGEAARRLEERGLLQRERHDHSESLIAHVAELTGAPLPADLADFYRERIKSVGDYASAAPARNGRLGWRPADWAFTRLLAAKAVPILWDGCGSLFAVDLLTGSDNPAVYFFDHEQRFETASYAASSSISAFLRLMLEAGQVGRDCRPRAGNSR